MQYDIQHTYRGRTAGGWLRTAKIVEMNAGNREILVDADPGEYVVVMTDGANMILTDQGGFVAMLDLSSRAYRKLESLGETAEALVWSTSH